MDVDTQVKRIPELWFDDGNIILQAGNSQFRVYRGILAARSTVFQDMLSLPQPPDSELVDGCPTVRLPDSERDVTVFLRAIFDSSFFMPFPTRTTFNIVKGCLRLGNKYGVDYLFRRALIHMSAAYNTTLSSWDQDLVHIFEDESDGLELATVTWERPDEATYRIFFIQLIREVNALWLLPDAFYCLSPYFEELRSEIIHGGTYEDEPTSLSIEDQTAFLKGHEVQAQSTTTDILRFLSHPPLIHRCASSVACNRARLLAIDRCRGAIRDNPGRPLTIWDDNSWKRLDVCSTCLVSMKKMHQADRQAFWDKLPEIYGLPPWNELEKMKVDAIGTPSEWFY
ncbi:hypothetical protein MSAN_02496200 [Mycena sanguinolenta]|uniref:BTB domain-containing protein n=1 Tax=Mycena sanguinolenta TaxID=230812 RepID=A0A8H6WT70_9AGAR|nr:hypothetical protein MSAN_02496200 [Mycena sanguinolenta]